MSNELTIICGDALTKLRELPAESVQCCVTSPPYWGLRDYGTAAWEGGDDSCDHVRADAQTKNLADSIYSTRGGAKKVTETPPLLYTDNCGKCGARRIDSQLGLERTPEEYVAKMVEVFREVRRVLRKDGTLWLNLSSSYAGSWGNYGGENRGDGSQREIVTGSKAHQKSYDGLERWRPPASYVARRGARPCDSDGKAQSDSLRSDSGCFDLCDECRAALSSRTSGSDQPHASTPHASESKVCKDVQTDSQQAQPDVLPLDVQASSKTESSPQSQAECSHCANCGVCLSVLRSSTRDGSLCVRKAECNHDNAQLESASRNQRKDTSGVAYSTIAYPEFKAKDLVPIPWMVAMALQADGWWLRSDIIWAKPNPMPESVTDRPTKSHEYLFLLTKSATYYYDSEAIKERYAECTVNDSRVGVDVSRGGIKDYEGNGVQNPSDVRARIFNNLGSGRNKRSVWTIATAPYPEAHFATYPPDLIKPCIMAGTSAKGCCAKCQAPWERIVERESFCDVPRGSNPSSFRSFNDPQQAGVSCSTKTLGWQPTCKCDDLYCAKCCVVVVSNYHEKPITTGRNRKTVPVVQDEILRSDGSKQVVHSPLQDQVGNSESKAGETWEGSNANDEGIHDALPSESSERKGRRLRDGASGNHGESDWSLFETGGSGAPPEPQEGRQSVGEFGTNDEAGSRPEAETEASEICAVSALQETDFPFGICGTCGNPLEFRPAETVPSTVLDCFAGSGTTGAVSLELGRKAVLIELNPAYVELIEQRCDVTMGLQLA